MRIRVLALLFTLLGSSFISRAQDEDISFNWEPFLHQWEEGVDAPSLVALNGYITWRLSVEIVNDETGLEDEPEVFSSIVGEEEDPNTEFLPLSILWHPSEEMLLLDPDTCCIFQHSLGTALASGVNPLLFPTFPALEYDSWVTIGFDNSLDMIDPILTVTDSDQNWVANFEDCTEQGILASTNTGGGWFTTINLANTNSFFDENNEILIAQFTVAAGCSIDSATLCLQYFIDGDQNQENLLCLEFDQPAACVNNPIFSSINSFTDTLACVGDTTGNVEFSYEGGSNSLNAFLYDSENNLIQGPILGTDPNGNTSTFENLSAGTYYVIVEDETLFDVDGTTLCSTVTEEFTIYEADEPLSMDYEVTEQVACAGLNEGEIEIVVTGGFTPYSEPTCSFPGYEATEVSTGIYTFSNLDSTEDDLAFSVTDSLGCVFNLTVPALGIPGNLVVEVVESNDVTCFGDNDGNIELNITSSGIPEVTWTSNTTLVDANAEDLENLGPGWFHFTVDDGTSCEFVSDTIFIIEPELLEIIDATPTFIECFGECNSTIDITTSGGTGEISNLLFQDVGNGPEPATNGELCAGTVALTVADTNNCFSTTNVIISQFPEISANPESTNVTCPNGADGTICISPTGGDGGVITVEISPLADYNSVTSCFEGLGAETYTLTSTDATGCSVVETVVISQPNPFIVSYDNQDMSCFGICDGSITVTNVSGGTEPYDYEIFDGVDFISNPAGSFIDLCGGSFDFTITDADGCQFIEENPIEIIEPPLIEILSLETAPAGCGGDNTATAEIMAQGGTAPLIPFWNGDEATFDSDLISVNDGLPDGENTILIIDQNGCELDSTFTIMGSEPLVVSINSTNVTCTGMCDGTQSVTFIGGDGNYSSTLPDIPTTGVCEGNYPVFVEDGAGCEATDTIHIGANLTSDIEYSLFTTPVSCWNENDGTATIAVTGGFGEISYLWSDPSSQSTATAIGLVEDFYTVTITDTVGCTFTENLIIEPTIGCFFIADALTPNGDGFNDEWILGGIEFFPEAKVEVFNRWGQLVYQSEGIYTPWDGKFNNERLPISDYYYVITFDPNATPLTGSVTIKY